MFDIKKILEKSLNPNEIYMICKIPFKLILYSDMHKFTNIDQLFGNNKFIIILYEYQKNIGHYVLLFKFDNATIEYFDSVYLFPDLVLKKLPQQLRISLNENKSYLVDLLIKSNYNLEYNNIHLQSHNSKISTCGRWCALRIMNSELTIEEFNNIFLNKSMSPDLLCSLITYDIVGF